MVSSTLPGRTVRRTEAVRRRRLVTWAAVVAMAALIVVAAALRGRGNPIYWATLPSPPSAAADTGAGSGDAGNPAAPHGRTGTPPGAPAGALAGGGSGSGAAGSGSRTASGPSASSGSGASASSGSGSGSASSGSGSSSAAGSGSWPSAASTGVPSGVTLTSSGSLTVTTDGAVIDALAVSGSITVQADNVTIKNTRVTGSDFWGVLLGEGHTNLTVEDCEIAGTGNGFQEGIRADGVKMTVLRNYIHGNLRGIDANTGLVQDNYIDAVTSGTNNSNYGFVNTTAQAASSILTINHNVFLNPENQEGAVVLASGMHDVTVEDNLLAGGRYAFYGGGSGTANIHVLSNVFSKRFFASGGSSGPVDLYAATNSGNQWSGNVWEGASTAVAA